MTIFKNESFIYGLCWSLFILFVNECTVWADGSGGYDGRFYNNGCEPENAQVSDNGGWWDCVPSLVELFGCDVVYTEIRAGHYCRLPKPYSSQPYWPPVHLYCEQFTPFRISYYHIEARWVQRSNEVVAQCSEQLFFLQIMNLVYEYADDVAMNIAEDIAGNIIEAIMMGAVAGLTLESIIGLLNTTLLRYGIIGLSGATIAAAAYDLFCNIPSFACCAFICDSTPTVQYAHLPSCTDVWTST